MPADHKERASEGAIDVSGLRDYEATGMHDGERISVLDKDRGRPCRSLTSRG